MRDEQRESLWVIVRTGDCVGVSCSNCELCSSRREDSETNSDHALRLLQDNTIDDRMV